MEYTVLNEAGNFDTWKESHLKEIKAKTFSAKIGELLYANDEIKVWKIEIKPRERIGFRLHNNNYSCTSFTKGVLIARNINGEILLMRLTKGGHTFFEYRDKKIIHDLENIGENTVKVTIVEEIEKW